MIYIHSNSLIERCLFKHLNAHTPSIQIDSNLIDNNDTFEDCKSEFSSKTIVYSMLQMNQYTYLNSFLNELEKVDKIIDIAQAIKVEKFIIITYPGSFIGSENLFLDCKGKIEQKFYKTNIPCAFFHTQVVLDPYQKIHNFHALFFNSVDGSYIIPQKKSIQIYSITIFNLVSLILKSNGVNHVGHFDAFDEVVELKQLLTISGNNNKIIRVSPLYLYFQSFIGKYMSPTMMSLFLRQSMPMYSSRTEKEFGIKLASDKLNETEFLPEHNYKIAPVFGPIGYKLST